MNGEKQGEGAAAGEWTVEEVEVEVEVERREGGGRTPRRQPRRHHRWPQRRDRGSRVAARRVALIGGEEQDSLANPKCPRARLRARPRSRADPSTPCLPGALFSRVARARPRLVSGRGDEEPASRRLSASAPSRRTRMFCMAPTAPCQVHVCPGREAVVNHADVRGRRAHDSTAATGGGCMKPTSTESALYSSVPYGRKLEMGFANLETKQEELSPPSPNARCPARRRHGTRRSPR